MEVKNFSRIPTHTAKVLVFDEENGKEGVLQQQKGGTEADALDMSRMGKRQQLQRTFHWISIVGFVMILQNSWESILLAAQYGLQNGGTAGTIWLTTGVIIGIIALVASMAEMASMAPTAGGQYHWVSEFAPPSVQKPLSYLIGWLSALGWITSCPAVAQLTGTLVQGLVLLKNPNADFQQLYQITLAIMFTLLLAVGFNVFFSRSLPTAEGTFLIIHVLGYFAFFIVFWIMSDHATPKDVFTTFADNGGWGNQGISTLVGITTPLWSFLGPDAAVHMSEELKDAGSVLPSAMIWGTVGNAILGLGMLITLCFCVGDINTVLNGNSGIPVIEVTYAATGSYAATAVMTTVLILLSFVGTITCIATASRQIWAFARDKGFPFSSYIEHVKPGWDIPVNAITIVLTASLAILCLNFGSTVALNAIISLSNAALLISYITSLSLIMLRRIRHQPLLPRRWSLGRWGLTINCIAMAFLILSFILSFFPSRPLPAPADMNWAIVIFAFVIVAAMVDYNVRAHKTYLPPVELVKNVD